MKFLVTPCISPSILMLSLFFRSGNCPYGVDLAKNLVVMLQNVLWSCGTMRISFSRRTPEKVHGIKIYAICKITFAFFSP